jgi:hypothetical protein
MEVLIQLRKLVDEASLVQQSHSTEGFGVESQDEYDLLKETGLVSQSEAAFPTLNLKTPDGSLGEFSSTDRFQPLACQAVRRV